MNPMNIKNILQDRKKVLITLIVFTLLWGIWHWIKVYRAGAIPSQEAIFVEVQLVKQGNLPIEAQAVGSLVAAKNVLLTTEVPGKVAQILVRDGIFVKQGTPLIQLDDTVNKAKADSAQANLIYSEANYKRMVLLGKKGAISQQAIDQSIADFKEKKAIEKEARILAEKMQIVAPFDGVIGKIRVSPGEYVAVGQPLVSLTDTHNLRVEYTISEKYLAKLALGQAIVLKSSAFPDQVFTGKVSFISPTINTEDRTISIYADVPNQNNKLAPGLFVNVTQSLGMENNVLLIPSVSLVATIDGQQVFKVINGKAVSVAVHIGQRTEKNVQVTGGLFLNDTIVTAGQHKIKDGTPVKLKA